MPCPKNPPPLIYSKNYAEGTVKTYANVIGRNYFGNCCSLCGYKRRKGKVDTHHKNGNVWDNRLENLQNLCRKCHQKVQYQNDTGNPYNRSEAYREKMRCLMTGRETNPEWYIEVARKNSIVAKGRERDEGGKFVKYNGGDAHPCH